MIENLQNAAWNRAQALKKTKRAGVALKARESDRPDNIRDRDRADPGAENRTADVRSQGGHIDFEA